MLDAALQITDGIHLAEIDPDGDDGLCDFRRQTGHDNRSTEEARSFYGLHQVIGHRRIHCRHARDVDHHHLGAIRAYAAQQLLGQLARSLRIDDTDDGQDQQPLAHLQYRR